MMTIANYVISLSRHFFHLKGNSRRRSARKLLREIESQSSRDILSFRGSQAGKTAAVVKKV